VNNQKWQLVKLKNPWKTGEWLGDFSDKSKLWDTRLRHQLQMEDKDDGIFWMPFKDFVKHFNGLTICKVFDEDCDKLTVCGQWLKGSTAGGCPNFPSTWDNPQ